MEIKTIEVPYMGDERQIFEIFVRKNEDVGYYLIPKDEVIDLLPLLKKGEINYEAVPANSDQIGVLPVRLSKYDVSDLDEKDVVALYTDIQIDELYEVMEYIHTHDNRYDNIILRIYKNSELPEFRTVLNEKAMKSLSPEYQQVFSGYMKLLLDLNDSDRIKQLMRYSNQNEIAKMLLRYTDEVRAFIFDHVTIRMAQDLQTKIDKLSNEKCGMQLLNISEDDEKRKDIEEVVNKLLSCRGGKYVTEIFAKEGCIKNGRLGDWVGLMVEVKAEIFNTDLDADLDDVMDDMMDIERPYTLVISSEPDMLDRSYGTVIWKRNE